MSPELFDPEEFNLKDNRQTKHSDCYALGMVIYEVLSGQAPFSKYHRYSVVVRILKGERPERPQGEEGAWFVDDIWSIVERCWKARPGDRPSIKDVLRCLEKVSRSRTVPLPKTVAGPPITDSAGRGSGSGTEGSTDGGEVSSPSQAVSSQPPRKLPPKGDPDKNDICPSAHWFLALPRRRSSQATYRSIIPPPKCRSGRPRILDAERVLSVTEQLEGAPESYPGDIQDWGVAPTTEAAISRGTLARLIKNAGFSYKMLHKAAAERDEAARVEFRDWARDCVTADMVVTAEESRKNTRTVFGRWGWSVGGASAGTPADPNRGARCSILAAISANGYVATRVLVGSVNSQAFFDFIVSDVVRS